MRDLFNEISKFTASQRKTFLDSIFNDEKKSVQFLNILKNTDQEIKDGFLEGLPKDSLDWWNESLNEVKIINESEINEGLKEFKEITQSLDKIIEKNTEINKEKNKEAIKLREYLKAGFQNCGISDQTLSVPIPPVEKEYDKNGTIIELPKPDKKVLLKDNIFDCIGDRKSRRKYTDEKLSIEELSYLLWATQGVKKEMLDHKMTLRTVPSGGARQPFETYLLINNVNGIPKGVYRYLPLKHNLIFLYTNEDMIDNVNKAAYGQNFVGNCAVCFIWSTIPYRCEWRYTTEAKKIIAQDSGHLCQNLYLAAESINCGTCGIGAYDQKLMDEFLSLDGIDEFVVYAAPVGKVLK